MRTNQIKRLLKKANESKHKVVIIEYLQSFLNVSILKDGLPEFVVLDTETTSLDVAKAKLLSIGVIKVSEDTILLKSAQEYFVSSPTIEEKDAIKIHGIRNKDLELKGLAIEEILLRLLAILKGKIIIAHHARFDAAMLDKYFVEYFSVPLLNPLLDTALLARKLDRKGLELPPLNDDRYTLDALCKTEKIAQPDRHTALGDAYATALLFLKLKKKLVGRKISLNEEIFYG